VDGAIRKIVNRNPANRYEEISEFIHDLSYPNKLFIEKKHTPLIERNPLIFWKSVALLSLLTTITIALIK
jgi:hypothetical protein